MSYMREVDTFVVKIMGLEASSVDTIFVSHTNEPHFESVDCGMSMFHEIKGVECDFKRQRSRAFSESTAWPWPIQK